MYHRYSASARHRQRMQQESQMPRGDTVITEGGGDHVLEDHADLDLFFASMLAHGVVLDAGIKSWFRKNLMPFMGKKPMLLSGTDAVEAHVTDDFGSALLAFAQTVGAAPGQWNDLTQLDGVTLAVNEERARGPVTITIMRRVPFKSNRTKDSSILKQGTATLTKVHVVQAGQASFHANHLRVAQHGIRREVFLDFASEPGSVRSIFFLE